MTGPARKMNQAFPKFWDRSLVPCRGVNHSIRHSLGNGVTGYFKLQPSVNFGSTEINSRRADCRASPAWRINLRSDATMVESAFAFGSRKGDLKGSNGILSTNESCSLHISIWRMASSMCELSLAAPPIEDCRLSWNALFTSYQLLNNSENCLYQIRDITTME